MNQTTSFRARVLDKDRGGKRGTSNAEEGAKRWSGIAIVGEPLRLQVGDQ